MYTLTDFSYKLPKERIAQHPMEPRDASKLLVYSRKDGGVTHKHFFDLPSLLTSNDVIVRNNTKVIPARLFGKRISGGIVEVLLVKHISSTLEGELWETLVHPGVKVGTTIIFGDDILRATCTKEQGYTREFLFNKTTIAFYEALVTCGLTPLPPYIEQDKNKENILRKQYQTLYAKHKGSSAAPTAGLHFTKEVDQALLDKGIQIEEVTLHVGLGTFLPVKTNDITKHEMHSEWFTLSKETQEKLNTYKKQGKRIIAVGTTTNRVLESCTDTSGLLQEKTGETNIFIYPPYKFKFVDALITNFHMSQSTLLMLICAFTSAPNSTEQFTNFTKSSIGKAYESALQHNYRFFSFGDAMLIQ